MRRKWLLILVVIASLLLSGCNTKGNIEQVDADGDVIMNMIEELTSEPYKGRLTGSEEMEDVRDYIHQMFRELSNNSKRTLIDASQTYTQYARLMSDAPEFELLSSEGELLHAFTYIEDFMQLTSQGQRFSGSLIGDIKIVENLDDVEEVQKNTVYIIKYPLLETWLRKGLAVRLLESENLDALVVVQTDADRDYFPVSPYVHPSIDPTIIEEGPFVINVSEDSYQLLLEAESEGYQLRIQSSFYLVETEAQNILYVLEGTTDEVLVIGAHYDHVGDNMNGTYNPGAMDNASGVAVVYALAEALMEESIQLEQTIVFALFDGEEAFLYGSTYYTENPIYPLEQTSMINIDTVGSKYDVPLHIESVHYLTSQLQEEFVDLASKQGITYEVGESHHTDHGPFAEKGCDVVNLIQPDFDHGYHSPMDTMEHLSKDELIMVTELIIAYLQSIQE